MAIFVKQEEKRINWFALGGISAGFFVMIAGTYYLFFAPVPLIDNFASPLLLQNEEVSNIDIGKAAREPVFKYYEKTLEPLVIPLNVVKTDFGRDNPFTPF